MRWKKEARGKPLDSDKKYSILNKLFQGRDRREIAREESVAWSTVYKLSQNFPLFFNNLYPKDD